MPPESLTRAAPGARLGSRYVVAERIGAGGMGSVWRAWDLREARWLAVKVLGRYDAASLERFVREHRLQIRHRHVLQPTGWAEDGDRTLFAMDLVRGGSAHDLGQRHGSLPEGFVRVLLDQVLGALAAVHAAGVVHRDVKPGNLLLEPTGTGLPWVRLGDFGIAFVTGDERLTEVAGEVGSGGYLAPEAARGAAPDPRQDLYAAGIVARQLLTGVPPRDGAPPVGGPLGALVRRLTDADPAHRPGTATAALRELRGIGVPDAVSWREVSGLPDVVDRFPDQSPPRGWRGTRVPAYAVQAAGAFAGAAGVGGLGSWLVLR